MYPPRRAKARGPAPAPPLPPAFRHSSYSAGVGASDGLSLVGKAFEPSHQALTKTERDSLAYFNARREKRPPESELEHRSTYLPVEGDTGGKKVGETQTSLSHNLRKDRDNWDESLSTESQANRQGAKSWLQSQGILFQGMTPKRDRSTASFSSVPEDHAAASPGHADDQLTPQLSEVDDSPLKVAEEEPGMTPPSRWQVMFSGKRAANYDDDDSAANTSPSTVRNLESKSIEEVAIGNTIRGPSSESQSNFGQKGADNIEDWIDSVKAQSDQIATDMLQRAGLSPDSISRGLNISDGLDVGDRLGHTSASSPDPNDAQWIRRLADVTHETNAIADADMDGILGSPSAHTSPYVGDDSEEAAAEARELLSSWMRIDEEANRIREAKARDATIRERVEADKRYAGVQRTRFTKRQVQFEETLRSNNIDSGKSGKRELSPSRKLNLRAQLNMLQQAGLTSSDASLESPSGRLGLQGAAVDENRAEAEAQAILTLAERMVLAPLNTSSPSKEERSIRLKNQSMLRGRRGDPLLMMEARQASIRDKREKRRARQQENERALKRMTPQERRRALALKDKEDKRYAREEAEMMRRAKSARKSKDKNLKTNLYQKSRRELRTASRANDRPPRQRWREGTDASMRNSVEKNVPLEEDESNKMRRAVIEARREVRSKREERELEERENERRRQRERLRWKLEQAKREEELKIERLEKRRRARKKAEFQIALMTRRRENRIYRKVFRAILLHAVRNKELAILKQQRERSDRARRTLRAWRKFCEDAALQRKEREIEARSFFEFRLLGIVISAWKQWTKHRARARAGKLAEMRMKSELRARRMREMAAQRLWYHRHSSKYFSFWFLYAQDAKETRLLQERHRERKERLDRLLMKARDAADQHEGKSNSRDKYEGKVEASQKNMSDNFAALRPRKSKSLSGRLPHMMPKVVSVTKTPCPSRNGRPLPPQPKETIADFGGEMARSKLQGLPVNNSATKSRTSFVDAMNQRALARKKRRDARRARYEQAEEHKRLLAAWKTAVSVSVAPEAAKAGRLYLRRHEARAKRRAKRLKIERRERYRQVWAKAVLHDVKQCMLRRGWRPWVNWLKARKKRFVSAVYMAQKHYLQSAWSKWSEVILSKKR